MAYTTMDDLSTGDDVTETIWDNQVKGNIEYLLNLMEPTLTNKSGSSQSEGAVVVADTSNDSAFTTTTTADNVNVIGVVKETIANDASGRVSMVGTVIVNVQGNVSRGDFLSTSTTAGRAASVGSSKTAGAFAKALTAYTGGGAGTVTAALMVSATSGMPANGTLYTTDGSAPSGFSEYTSARGRMIVGLPSGGTNEGTVGTALTNQQDKTHTHTYNTVIAHTHPIRGSSNQSGTSVINLIDTTGTSTDTATVDDTSSTGSASGTTATAAISDFLAYIQLMTISKD